MWTAKTPDWADAQADLSLRWAHSHFVGFVLSWLSFYSIILLNFQCCLYVNFMTPVRHIVTTYMPYLTLRDEISQNLARLEASSHKIFQISQNFQTILHHIL